MVLTKYKKETAQMNWTKMCELIMPPNKQHPTGWQRYIDHNIKNVTQLNNNNKKKKKTDHLIINLT